VGDFWSHIDTSDLRAKCHLCDVPEILEHIALDCQTTEQKLIWSLSERLWSKKYAKWPKLNWGLILGCNLVKFKSDKGVIIPEKGRLFAILVSVAWHLMWNFRRTRVIQSQGRLLDTIEVHNQWLKAVNVALRRDCILTDKIKLGPIALKKRLVLKTWSGLLMNEDSLPDDWTNEGVLVGMRPIDRHGIG
jgi:hypothetical protein